MRSILAVCLLLVSCYAGLALSGVSRAGIQEYREETQIEALREELPQADEPEADDESNEESHEEDDEDYSSEIEARRKNTTPRGQRKTGTTKTTRAPRPKTTIPGNINNRSTKKPGSKRPTTKISTKKPPTIKPKKRPSNEQAKKSKPGGTKAGNAASRNNRWKNKQNKPKKSLVPPKKEDENKKKKINSILSSVKNTLIETVKDTAAGIKDEMIDWTKDQVRSALDSLGESAREQMMNMISEVATDWIDTKMNPSELCKCQGDTCDCCAEISPLGSGCLTIVTDLDNGVMDLFIFKNDENDNRVEEPLYSTTITTKMTSKNVITPNIGILNPGLIIRPGTVTNLYDDGTGLTGCFSAEMDLINFEKTWCVEYSGEENADISIAF